MDRCAAGLQDSHAAQFFRGNLARLDTCREVLSVPVSGILKDMELIFEVRDAEEGGYYARALGHAIFTEAGTWSELRANVLEAVSLHFEDVPVQPRLVKL
jgi:hypothetical protein